MLSILFRDEFSKVVFVFFFPFLRDLTLLYHFYRLVASISPQTTSLTSLPSLLLNGGSGKSAPAWHEQYEFASSFQH